MMMIEDCEGIKEHKEIWASKREQKKYTSTILFLFQFKAFFLSLDF